MKELNNIKIIAVDHGYGNIKTANTVTPTGVTAYETEPIFSGNILEHGGIYYRIGEGHKAFIADKAMDEDYYILTLMAVARELNVYGIRDADVHLAAQIVKPSATVLLKKSTGEIKSRHFLGRLLIKSRTASRRSLERVLKSKPRGKKNLKTSLTFSFEPLCQGE